MSDRASEGNDNKDDEDVALEDSCFMFALPEDSSDEGESEPVLNIKYDVYLRRHPPTDPRIALEATKENADMAVKLALVSRHHSLWAEYVYNAARILADLMDHSPHISQELPRIDVRGKKCLELGAGAGLPGIMAILKGASQVVISDYGHDADLSLIYPIDINIDSVRHQMTSSQSAYAVGYVWGQPVDSLCEPDKFYQSSQTVTTDSYAHYLQSKLGQRIESSLHTHQYCDNDLLDKFDILILADLIFNRSEHSKLLWTVKHTLRKDGVCWVSFSHHDPQKRDLDLNFFELAKSEPFNLTVSYIGKEVRKTYPFQEGDGMDEQRGVVYLYTLTL